ncbi:MAG: SDR family NAD(P)-dependent oxidoreductase [Gaiellales bacterium]|jgi:3-oxoacyl-[acyl-carrier protein] reductase
MAHERQPVAVVTGAANGIGAAVAARLREDGMLVVGLDMEPCDVGPSVEVDVSAIEGHDPLIERLAAEHGPIKALVNVAGIFIPESVADLTPASYRRQLGVMLDGPIWLARAAGLHMARNGGGRIVNVTSIHASNSERTALSYDAAKGGLEAATRTLALELGEHGVLVNSLAPGFVRTRMSVVNGVDELEGDWFKDNYVESGRLPVRRAAEPSEIAGVVSFLVSEDNTYTNGARVVVDGGLTVTF